MLTATQFDTSIPRDLLTLGGSIFITIGISVPLALYFQNPENVEALRLRKVCSEAGIDAIYKSRSQDSRALRASIDEAVSRSRSVSLQGVAFRSFFNPSNEYTEETRRALDDPRTSFRILLVDPNSTNAKRRADIEIGSTTLEDIAFTINYGIPGVIIERLKVQFSHDSNLMESVENIDISKANDMSIEEKDVDSLSDVIDSAILLSNIHIRLYSDISAFLMIFDDRLFNEQYHVGRPDVVRANSCIGKNVPVIQYNSRSRAYVFFKAHYEEEWKYNKDNDITRAVMRTAIVRCHQFLRKQRESRLGDGLDVKKIQSIRQIDGSENKQ